MIIKFDHITYVLDRKDKGELKRWKKNGWAIRFAEEQLKNLSTKKTLMYHKTDTHDLYFMEKPYHMNTELIFYDRVNEENGIFIQNQIIYATCTDLKIVEEAVRKVGIRNIEKVSDQEIICNLKGIFDKKDYFVVFRREEILGEVVLDNMGYGCVTLLVDSINKLIGKFSEDEIFYSKNETLTVDSRVLNVAFLKIKGCNLIFEFICGERTK